MRTLRLASPCALLLATACSEDSVDPLVAALGVAPAMVDLGDVYAGYTGHAEVAVRNSGALAFRATLTLRGDGHGADYDFALSPTSFALPPGGVQMVRVDFTPTVVMTQPVMSAFVVQADASGRDGQPLAATVQLTGRGVASGFRVEPNPLDFGTVLVGSSRTLRLQLINDTPLAVAPTGEIDGDGQPLLRTTAGNGHFSVRAMPGPDGSLLPAGRSLPPGERLELEVTYEPDPVASEADSARWVIAHCPHPACDLGLVFTGRGSRAAFACAPSSVAFGRVNPGASASRTVACSNFTSDPVEVIDWSLDANSAAAYSVEAFRPTTLPPDEALSVEVTLRPTLADLAAGEPLDGELVIRGRNTLTGDGVSPARVPLTGGAGGPTLELVPEQLDFGTLAVGTRDRRHLAIVNTGFDPLHLTDLRPTDAAYSTTTSSLTLAAGTSTVIEVWYTPAVAGSAPGELVVESDDAARPQAAVALLGAAQDAGDCAQVSSPLVLSYGIVELGRSARLELSITNQGSGECLVNRLEVRPVGGTSPLSFTLANGPQSGLLIPPNAALLVPVDFTPQTAGAAAAELSYYVSDPAGSSRTVPLAGVGLGVTQVGCPAPATVDAGSPLQLVASGQSQTPTTALYGWRIIGAPQGGIGTPFQWSPDPPAAATVTFLPRLVGTYRLEASLTDGLGFTATCTTAVTALAHGLRVELAWDGLGDVDLHLHNANPTPWFGRGGPLGSNEDDCFYAGCNEQASPAGPLWDPGSPPYQGGNPGLDIDNIVGLGPENIHVDAVNAGDSFTVALHYFWDHGYGQRISTVNVYCGRTAAPTATFVSQPMDGVDQGGCTANTFWKVTGVTFTSTGACQILPIDVYQTGADACLAF